MGILLVIGAIVFIAIIVAVVEGSRKTEALRTAQAAYQAALTELKHAPGNTDLRLETLRLGRAYANLTRNQTGVTIFDEVALMNDINAIIMPAPSARLE